MRDFEFHPDVDRQLSALVDERLMRPWADAVRDDAQRGAPRKSGDLADDIRVEKVNDFHRQIGSDLKYAAAQELGAQPHTIRVRSKKVLANQAEGKIFGKVVNHPGNPAHPYLRPALYRERAL